MAQSPQQIDLASEDEEIGRAELAKMGVPIEAQFVCFHVRDPAYWQERRPGIGNDSDYRNARLENYFDAMKAVAARGYYVIRIGATTGQSLPDLGERVIDYATKHRTEFMDVFLAARCEMMVSTASGIDAISYMFRRPMVFSNVAAWGYLSVNMVQPFITITKLFKRDGQTMSFAEIVGIGAQDFAVSEEYAQAGITVVENTPDEITASALEMLDHIEGRQIMDSVDEVLQDKIRALIRQLPRFADWQFRISPHFLRKHRALI
jgi:putative glycosyltransferase (TIGR04372 family)